MNSPVLVVLNNIGAVTCDHCKWVVPTTQGNLRGTTRTLAENREQATAPAICLLFDKAQLTASGASYMRVPACFAAETAAKQAKS